MLNANGLFLFFFWFKALILRCVDQKTGVCFFCFIMCPYSKFKGTEGDKKRLQKILSLPYTNVRAPLRPFQSQVLRFVLPHPHIVSQQICNHIKLYLRMGAKQREQPSCFHSLIRDRDETIVTTTGSTLPV